MNIPQNLKVGGHSYAVNMAYRFKDRTDIMGQANHQRSEIVVSDVDCAGNPLERTQSEQTFVHELVHCVDQVYNNNKLDEDTVARISEGLYQVLKDNDMLK